MKQFLSFLLYILIFVAARGQSTYAEAMRDGDDAFKNQEYKKAINKYFAAEAFDPAKKDEVKTRVNKVFDKIEKLRGEAIDLKNEAYKQKQTAVNALIDVKQSKIAADSAKDKALTSDSITKAALSKSQKLIDAFYFYEGRFALAYKHNRYGFINKQGDAIIGYQYTKAEQFNEYNGFARVKNYYWTDFLIDTFGNEYKAAYDIKDIDSSTRAVDLSGKFLTGYSPEDLFKYQHLKILIWQFNALDKLPREIGQLTNLKSLDLSGNALRNLPVEISSLQKLTFLNLEGSPLKSLPRQVYELRNLQTLNLSNIKLDSLPKEIGELKNLKSLNLASNNLRSLPAETGDLENLESLNLYYNQLTSLPKEISKLKKMRYLLLTGNNSISQAEINNLKVLLPDCKIIREAK